MIILESDHSRLVRVLDELRQEANAKLSFLFDKNGQQLASSSDLDDVDLTALASLTAGNVAATEGLGQLIGEDEFTTLFHEGRKESLHISVISKKTILLLLFDERSSLGLVRLRVQQRSPDLASIVDEILERAQAPTPAQNPLESLGEITDEEIDALFG